MWVSSCQSCRVSCLVLLYYLLLSRPGGEYTDTERRGMMERKNEENPERSGRREEKLGRNGKRARHWYTAAPPPPCPRHRPASVSRPQSFASPASCPSPHQPPAPRLASPLLSPPLLLS
ncbi:hypothetical protein Pmani_005649 [Petrolisthes manimaculis]|uniref:Secreted protein n=1 Tax=Petrolisthes manimaculis TaxID=1843537 RepID=A0AAE1QC14_9EUCA|nr:hypothetical protein Pmani_005649 [Petrolisthes manimaculis]